MNVWITLIISLFSALIFNISKKYYMSKNASSEAAPFLYNAVCSVAAAVVLFCWGGLGEISLYSVLLGIVFGVLTMLCGVANLAALRIGPMSYTTVIICFSTIISALSGVMFFGEGIAWVQIVGIALMLASFVFAVDTKSESEKKANLRWLAICMVAFFACGFIGIMQKIHQSSAHKNELNAFLVVAFVTSAIVSFIISLPLMKKDEVDSKDISKRSTVILVGAMLVGGIGTALNNKLNLYLSGVMDSAIFFPIVNGGSLILATLAALIIFNEKLTRKQWFGIIIGMVSVILLCNPFA